MIHPVLFCSCCYVVEKIENDVIQWHVRQQNDPSDRCYPQISLIQLTMLKSGDKGERFASSGSFGLLRLCVSHFKNISNTNSMSKVF